MDDTTTVLPASLQTTLAQLAQREGRVLFLTGAGISADSGIPTFRGEEGFWTVGSKNYQPTEMATQASWRRMPEEVWRWYLYRRSICRAAQPNRGHDALVQAEAALGDRFALVTQNVDGLHLRAGNSAGRTRQIHGNIDFMRCLADGREHLHAIADDMPARSRDAPFTEQDRALLSCADGRLARPHVLWFDECYDERLFSADTAVNDAQRADLLVVVGTAGATNLPMQIGALALRRGIGIVDINPSDNPFSEAAEHADSGWALRGSASQWLPAIVSGLSVGPNRP